MEENDDPSIWSNLPMENRERIEDLFAKILIRYLHSTAEEVNAHEQR
jgi:hypothetical protein